MAALPSLSLSIINLDAQEWNGMVAFYRDVLGLEPIVLEHDHRYGWFSVGSVTLALRGVNSLPMGEPRVSLQFEVDDIRQAIRALELRGCHFYDKQLDTGESYEVAYFHDPERNSLAVYSRRNEV